MYPAYRALDMQLDAGDTSDHLYTSLPHMKHYLKPQTVITY